MLARGQTFRADTKLTKWLEKVGIFKPIKIDPSQRERLKRAATENARRIMELDK